MKKRDYVIGVDGGGTKTTALLADLEGNIVAEKVGGPTNIYRVGIEKACQEILNLLISCCRSVGCKGEEIRAVALGLAGAGRAAEQKMIRQKMQKVASGRKFRIKNLVIDSDARVALEGAFGSDAGMVLISGTGSIGLVKDHRGNIHRVGGWGRAIGDEGSGYAIGLRAMSAIAKHLDGRGEPTILTRLAAKRFGLSNPETIISKVYQDHFDLASLAPLVLAAAENEDRVSKRILDDACIELLDHVRVLIKKLSGPRELSRRKRVKLVWLGGIFMTSTPNGSGSNYLLRRVTKMIRSSFPNILIQRALHNPAYGAMLLALQHLRMANSS